MFSDKKSVSRERLIGISFVDILIQAVFLLFIALTVGYQDPVVIERIREYEAFGKDICNKANKNSIKECREVVEPVIDKAVGKGLSLCIPPKSGERSILTARFIVVSPSEIRFLEFTKEYYEYLSSKGYEDKLSRAKATKTGVYAVASMESVFGFIREEKCIHSVTIRKWEGAWRESDLTPAFNALYKLQTMNK